jgi:hypothetical protein
VLWNPQGVPALQVAGRVKLAVGGWLVPAATGTVLVLVLVAPLALVTFRETDLSPAVAKV